jgi:hypothetical protein
MSPELSHKSRFQQLFEEARNQDSSTLVAIVDRPYIQGSLGFEHTSVGGIVCGEVVSISNTDVAGFEIDQTTETALDKLESIK